MQINRENISRNREFSSGNREFHRSKSKSSPDEVFGYKQVTSNRRGQAPAGTDRVGCYGSGLATGEDILLDDRVNAPISINHLGDAEVDANRN